MCVYFLVSVLAATLVDVIRIHRASKYSFFLVFSTSITLIYSVRVVEKELRGQWSFAVYEA